MNLPRKSASATDIDIANYYAIKASAIWSGLKQEGPAFWWLCIYLFFEYVRPQSIYPAVDILPWTQIAIVFAFIAALADKKVRYVRHPGNLLMIMFFVVVLVASVFAFDPSRAFEKFSIPVNWLMLYFLVITVVNTEKKFFVFLLLFLLVNFKMSQHGFVTYAQRGFGYARWGLSGSPGWFQNAGDFGIQMTIFAPLAMTFVLALRPYWGRIKRLFFYLFPFTAVVSIIGSASRGAQLGLAAIGIWFLVKSRRGLKAMAGILVVGWLLFSILPEQMLDEYRAAGDDETSQHRLALWRFGLDVVREHPILGVGPENIMGYCSATHPGGFVEETLCQVLHNTYIEAASETGIIGLLVFIFVMIFIFLQNAQTRANAARHDKKLIWYIAHGLDGGLVGYMIASIFFSTFFYPMIWIQLSLTVALNEISKKKLLNSTRLS